VALGRDVPASLTCMISLPMIGDCGCKRVPTLKVNMLAILGIGVFLW